MKPTLLALLLAALPAVAVADTPPPQPLFAVDFALATEDARNALVIPATVDDTEVRVEAKTTGGTPYGTGDIAHEGGVAALRLQPEKQSYLQVTLPEAAAPGNDDFTVVFRYKPASGEVAPGFLASAGTAEPTWIVALSDTGKLTVSFNGHALGSGGATLAHPCAEALEAGAWNHVALVFDRNGSIVVYLNGRLDSTSAPISAHTEALPGRIYLGGPHNYPNGELGAFAVFRGKLSDEQIHELAQAAPAPAP